MTSTPGSPPTHEDTYHARNAWWPPFGALYYIVAVKRVRGMRLVGLVRDEVRLKAVTAPAPVAATQRSSAELDTQCSE